jgi:ABC-type transporter Mla maintaining outer membrane lipid asymmetry permease subunit MlaE
MKIALMMLTAGLGGFFISNAVQLWEWHWGWGVLMSFFFGLLVAITSLMEGKWK